MNNQLAIQVESRYELTLQSIERIEEGTDNHTYQVTTTNNTYYLKLFDEAYNDNKQNQLQRQFTVLNHLSQSPNYEYDVNKPVPNKYGNTVSRFNNGYGWLSRSVPGENHTERNKANIEELARSLADYHGAIEDLTVSMDYEEPLESLIDDIQNKYEKTKNTETRNIIEDLLQQLTTIKEDTKLPRYLKTKNTIHIHGDFTLENTLFRDEAITGVIDFDNTRVAPAAEDIGWSLMSIGFDDDNKYHSHREETFLKAYHSKRFDTAERRMMRIIALTDLIAIANAVLDPGSSLSQSKSTLKALHEKTRSLHKHV